ncbi:MAG: hypothetical protein U1E52_01805 [Geminicoccaceae bacterium]
MSVRSAQRRISAPAGSSLSALRVAQATRAEVLVPLLDRLSPTGRAAPQLPPAGEPLGVLIADPMLRDLLTADPALAALLPGVNGSIRCDNGLSQLCRIEADRTIRLAGELLDRPAAAVWAVRWSLQLLGLLDAGVLPLPRQRVAVVAALAHGRWLARGLAESDRQAIAGGLPAALADALLSVDGDVPAVAGLPRLVTVAWLRDLVAASSPDDWRAADAELCLVSELCRPLELLLVAGGDERLKLDAATGMNRYGTVPRPRPEAIQFSSSTASSISDYAFRLCADLQGRLLRRAEAHGAEAAEPHLRLADAVRREIARLLGLDAGSGDIVLTASGTDTELLAVALALAADDRPLANILIAPEETGRGVVLAGQGRYFGEQTSLGLPVHKGEALWPQRRFAIRTVPIRDEAGGIRPVSRISAETRGHVEAALAAGERVLLHLVLGSKTGISAPPLELVEELRALDPGRVDVVVDACQLRVSPTLLGDLVRRGWMLQISGSKFLTGPAFSGALLLPPAMRDRVDALASLLRQAPGISVPADWPPAWREQLELVPVGDASMGALFRWVAALCEAELLGTLPADFCHAAFEGFSEALLARLSTSTVLVPLAPPDGHLADLGAGPPGLSARSIICFALARDDGSGVRRPVSLEECQLLFECLNKDVSGWLQGSTPAERRLAARPAHIGQPVALRPDCPDAPIVLRLVVGARFFTIVGFPDDAGCEAALAAEIGDAVTALDKLELLVRHLPDLRRAAAS